MRKVIRKRIRHKEDGLDLAVDFNADVAVNVGRSGAAEVPDATDEDRQPVEDRARPPRNDEEGSKP